MVKTAKKLSAFALAIHMLLLPLALAVHIQSHTHSYKHSAEDQWKDGGASQCQLCADFFHKAIDYRELFTVVFYPVEYSFQFFPYWNSGFNAIPILLFLRGPPFSI